MLKPRIPLVQWGHRLNQGLVAAWLFTEGAGTIVDDHAHHQFNFGKIGGTPVWAEGPDGPCLVFDGTTTYIDATNTVGRYCPRYTIAARIFPTNIAAFPMILARGQGSQRNFELDIDTAGKLRNVFTQGFNTFKVGTATNALTLSVWSTVATTFDGTTMAFFQNGVANGTAANAFTPDNDGTMLSIGSLNTANKFFGRISEVRLWDRALTPAEIYEWENTNYSEFRPSSRQSFLKPHTTVAPAAALQTAVSMM